MEKRKEKGRKPEHQTVGTNRKQAADRHSQWLTVALEDDG